MTATISGKTFTGNNGDDLVASGNIVVTNVPAGLTAKAIRVSPTEIRIELTGNATSSLNGNDTNDLKIEFLDGAFTQGASTLIGNSTKDNKYQASFSLY